MNPVCAEAKPPFQPNTRRTLQSSAFAFLKSRSSCLILSARTQWRLGRRSVPFRTRKAPLGMLLSPSLISRMVCGVADLQAVEHSFFGAYCSMGRSNSLSHCYSYRKATIGSTLAARRAGSQQAIKATTINSTTMTLNVSGSVGLTP